MNEDIKLYIGEIPKIGSKLPWLPTLDSVLNTQRYIKNTYNYMTIIIFKKLTDDNFIYNVNYDVTYTSSMTDSLTEHSGVDESILMNGLWDYYDGNYYYCYLVLYSNTFDLWNISNDATMYAILYDQSTVNIVYPYMLNEWRISKNVEDLIINTTIYNVNTLVIPNKNSSNLTFSSYYGVANCNKFRLYNEINPTLNQEIETLNGLLYSINQTRLIAVPRNYQANINGDIILSTECSAINVNSFQNGSDYYEINFNTLYGQNVFHIENNAFENLNFTVANFPNLNTLGDYVFLNNEYLTTLYLPTTLERMYENSINTLSDKLTTIYFELNFGINLATPLYLQHCNALNVDNLALQFNNLATVGGGTIYLHTDIFNSLLPEQIAIATDKGWKVETL